MSVSINSSQQFNTLRSSATYTIAYFTASWCGPCKVISPIFDQLATAESKPGRIIFCKIDVDAQRDIASTYGISSMPTFLILKGSSIKETVRGANATALRTAVLSAAADAAKSAPKSSSATFSGKGQTLGGQGQKAPPAVNVGAMLSSPANFAQASGWPNLVVRFLGLYFVSLFSLEPGRAAEESGFAVKKVGGGARVGGVR